MAIDTSPTLPVVDTTGGPVQGFRRDDVHVFRGVPYGASTAGPNRFQPPQPVEPWAGVRASRSWGPICPQESWKLRLDDHHLFVSGSPLGHPSEDCLNLNVWTPGIDAARRPVMVWLHGGAFFLYSSQVPQWDGENLARHGEVVVVSMNHRIGALGFMNLAEYGEGYARSGTAGMLDLVAALEWVRDNIANFGGDPDSVTIFGQSGGGAKVAHLMAMPRAHGLFHRAAIQSGGLQARPHQETALVGAALLEELGITTTDVAKVRDVPAEVFVRAGSVAIGKAGETPGGAPAWAPTLDGDVIPCLPFEDEALALSAHVPLLNGTVLNEFVNGVDRPELETMHEGQLRGMVTGRFGESAPEIIDAYRAIAPDASPFELFSQIVAGWMFRASAVDRSRRHAASSDAGTYMYWFTFQPELFGASATAYHSSDVPFVFRNTDSCEQSTGGGAAAREMSERMADAWVQFARTGNPSHAGLPEWPPYDEQGGATMMLDRTCEVRAEPDRDARPLVERSGVPAVR